MCLTTSKAANPDDTFKSAADLRAIYEQEQGFRPDAEDHRVPACESEAFVWAKEQPDGTLKYYFDVLNPQGLSAMAMSVILDETVSGQPLEQVAAISPEMVFTVFGREISMGKGQGLMGIVQMVKHEAKKRLAS